MADKEIYELTAIGTPDRDHLLYIVDAPDETGNSRKVTLGELIDFMTTHVETITGTTYNVLAADNAKYIRLTNAAAKSIIIDPDSTEPLEDNSEWHFRNVGAADATIVPGSGVTVQPPAGGTLVIPQDGTVTLKRVAADTFELFGQTVAA